MILKDGRDYVTDFANIGKVNRILSFYFFNVSNL